MNMVKRISKKKLLETYKNNYEIVLKRKQELYNENIKLQERVIEQDETIKSLKKENKVLKGKLTRALKKPNLKIEGLSIEKGNKIIDDYFKKEKEISKWTTI